MAETTNSSGAPTVVLVHGAFADSSSWNGVIERLQAKGVQVTAPANPLRGIAIDSAYVAERARRDPGARPRGRPLVRRRGDHERRQAGQERRRARLRRRLRPRRGRGVGRGGGGFKGQRPGQRAGSAALSVWKWRRPGRGVRNRSGEVPRCVRGGSAHGGDEGHGCHAAPRRRVWRSQRRPERPPGRTCPPGPLSPRATRRPGPM